MIGITMSEEGFDTSLIHEVEEDDILINTFKTVAVSIVFYDDTVCSQGSGPHWIGELNLNAFVENLPKLEKEYPHMYKYLMQNYKEIVDKAEQLIARLKLQDLPLPSVEVEHNNSLYCHEKTIVHSVYI